ncbi:tRNA (adenosine(37)-N6)-threonylcarbamoyltransferase complex dimerization subunit type 1 TsaB [Acinetobacter rathckeae]|uniref:tRNA (adenosine(37)-N6)-threonylcarbamoyltransferase complex dimerization subunit type 1 TsaB n=1 Tax=Acinetobacter rathckeae TaxID=2605272 RepID=UPI0018A32083|nr:tRNA (adenosine(37)-N6)-threonylcarbamoyltransferase complex dimerization subunit type 1 TsaB [Acinetobacter rathckeae]MBF7688899.1 tRNA (adenosine(37)-N6)-threonylcarbamoyltransferase complex dimerization subunit type 1 TsaB [Acinetobacter rathckeae]MBF7696696.1 tRNA (adenosine(37)-N6)-threonylcarbamoyltransferase complex dimerization subunit type 1 TsaB [Acinetobacter rathckeae]
MKLLALETANEQCSVAITDDTNLVFNTVNHQAKMQTQTLLPMIEQGLQQCEIQSNQINVIAFSRGPGSFSGVRINAAVAQALAWANDLPVVPVSTLQALAQAAYRLHGLTEVTTVLDAKMKEVYLAHFVLDENKVMQAVGEEQLLNYLDAQAQIKFTLVGSGAALLKPLATFGGIVATAEDVAYLGQYYAAKKAWVSAEYALPVYLRDNAWKKIADQGKA